VVHKGPCYFAVAMFRRWSACFRLCGRTRYC